MQAGVVLEIPTQRVTMEGVEWMPNIPVLVLGQVFKFLARGFIEAFVHDIHLAHSHFAGQDTQRDPICPTNDTRPQLLHYQSQLDLESRLERV